MEEQQGQHRQQHEQQSESAKLVARTSRGPLKRGTRLEVRSLPDESNNIVKLNEHFSKFGKVVNIRLHVQANGIADAKAAVVEFSTVAEAMQAHRSQEAVFGNRFIKVLWPQDRDAGPGLSGVEADVPNTGAEIPESANAVHAAPALDSQEHSQQGTGVLKVVGSARSSSMRAATATTGASTRNPSAAELEQQQDLVQRLIRQQKELVTQLTTCKGLSMEEMGRAKAALKNAMALTEQATMQLRAMLATGLEAV